MSTVSGEYLGFSLNTAQRLAVRMSLNKLKINEGNADISFWGKISGTARDYLIAQALTISDSISKKFYFSADEGVTFALLPEVDDWISEKSSVVRGMFTGNPANLYKDPNAPVVDEEEEEEEEEDEGDKEVDPSKRKLNELERLAHAVQCIDNDTCVRPRGAYHLTPTGDIKTNGNFAGLNSAESINLDNYLLLRNPCSAATLARVRKLGVSNNADFLDTIGEGQPQGVWVAQCDDAGLNTKLRSLVWPGYEFKLEASTGNYGGAYFGHGLKNEDVLFML